MKNPLRDKSTEAPHKKAYQGIALETPDPEPTAEPDKNLLTKVIVVDGSFTPTIGKGSISVTSRLTLDSDLTTWKRIDCTEEKEGLYYLDSKTKENTLGYVSKVSEEYEEQIWFL
ncbi:hypothetical protein CK203_025758 [Vitis vinifera]|uniref:Uncharacterized protein n=1 Tax=Vitis vinifera TaxID=29760 RepID=A0A438IGF6_VITVI|nr:hypothetical protein CK203_025758 [Vitis vinifera]